MMASAPNKDDQAIRRHNSTVTRLRKTIQFFIGSKYGPIIGLLVVNLLVGLIVANDYGQSWDEYYNYAAGKRSIQFYQGPTLFSDTGEDYYHGPFYFMVFSVTTPLFKALLPNAMTVDGRHFTNFLTFQLAIFSLYFICLRFVSPKIAFLTALLFTAQPLLWGHAFINQKDIPFMALFSAAVAAGLYAMDRRGSSKDADQQRTESADQSSRSLFDEVRSEWGQKQRAIRILFVLMVGIIGLLIVDLFQGFLILPSLENLLRAAYQGESIPLINWAFARMAAQSAQIPVEAYLNRLRFLFSLIRIPAFFLLVVILAMSIRYVFMKTWRDRVQPISKEYGPFILAAALLGVTVSTRIIGLFAGALISIYTVLALRKRVTLYRIAGAIVAYWGLALVITYLTWPALWGDPILSFRQLLLETANFQEHTVFYQGEFYPSSLLPWHFFTVVTALQLSIPALTLFIGGVLLAILNQRGQWDRDLLIVLALWISLPVLADITSVMNVYGNRHLLFVLPPIFVIASLAILWMFQRVKPLAARGLLVGIIVLPGMVSIIATHPYEYVYYNRLVGGLQGAVGRYQLDYWCIGYREAMEYVNAQAPSEATIAVWGPLEAASDFARTDLNMVSAGDMDASIQPYFTLECSDSMYDVEYLDSQNIVFEVKNGEALFAIVTR